MITAGMDFAYQFAHDNYMFLEKVFQATKDHPDAVYNKFKFRYSTVDEYYQAIWQAQKVSNWDWPVVREDFLPLEMNYPGHYWSGFYTSRPNLKKQIRDFTGRVQASDTLFTLDMLSRPDPVLASADLSQILGGQFFNAINRRIGTSMHHDTITGTSPPTVIQEAEATIDKLVEQNAQQLQRTMRYKVYKDEQVRVDKL
jgi:hypothetical protein